MIALVSPFPTSRNTWCCRLSPRRHSRMNTTRPSQCEDSSHSSPFWEASNFIEFWKNFRTRRHIGYVKMCWNMKESHEKALIRQKHVLCESCWHDSPCVCSQAEESTATCVFPFLLRMRRTSQIALPECLRPVIAIDHATCASWNSKLELGNQSHPSQRREADVFFLRCERYYSPKTMNSI